MIERNDAKQDRNEREKQKKKVELINRESEKLDIKKTDQVHTNG